MMVNQLIAESPKGVDERNHGKNEERAR